MCVVVSVSTYLFNGAFIALTTDATMATEFTINSAGALVWETSVNYTYYGQPGISDIIVTTAGGGVEEDTHVLCSVSGGQLQQPRRLRYL